MLHRTALQTIKVFFLALNRIYPLDNVFRVIWDMVSYQLKIFPTELVDRIMQLSETDINDRGACTYSARQNSVFAACGVLTPGIFNFTFMYILHESTVPFFAAALAAESQRPDHRIEDFLNAEDCIRDLPVVPGLKIGTIAPAILN